MEIILFASIFVSIFLESSGFNAATEYHLIPKLYHLDPYYECLYDETQYEENAYCMVEIALMETENSTSWNLVQKYSSPKWNKFDHSHLLYGVCVNECKREISALNSSELNELEFDVSSTLPSYMTEWAIKYEASDDDRFEHGELINQCLKNRIINKYNIKSHTRISYCNRGDKEKWRELGIGDVIALILIGVALLLNIVGTLSKLIRKDQNNFLSSFDVTDNIRSFLHDHESSKFKFVNSIKFYTMLLIIWIHCVVANLYFPMKNPEFVEDMYNRPSWKISINGTLFVHTFFIFSGFFMAKSASRMKKFNLSSMFNLIIFRYLRLLIFCIILILFQTTLIKFLGDGPVWRKFIETESSRCRENFWVNLIFLINFVKSKEMCQTPTWYLSADFQLFILSAICLTIIYNSPRKLRNLLISACFFVPMIITGITYFLVAYPWIYPPEPHRFLVMYDDIFQHIHISTFTCIDSYFMGILTEMLTRNEKLLTKIINLKIFKFIFYISIPMQLLLLASGGLFMTQLGQPSLTYTFYSTIIKKLWSIFNALLIIGCLQPNLIKSFFDNTLTVLLGKLTFVVYMYHLLVAGTLLATMETPTELSDFQILKTYVSTVVTTYLISLFFHVALERPLQNIIYRFKKKNN